MQQPLKNKNDGIAKSTMLILAEQSLRMVKKNIY